MSFDIVADLGPGHAELDRLIAAGEDLTPVMRPIAQILLDCVEENFAAGGRPERWVALKPSTIADKQAKGYSTKPLQRRGDLQNSLVSRADSTSAEAGVSTGRGVDRYAAIQNFGGVTSPHVIRARNGKALSWPGAAHPVKQVNHPGSNIPARPYLVLTDDARDEISAVVSRALQGK
jgi:phage gpG-like protein